MASTDRTIAEFRRELKIADDFEPPALDEWREASVKALKGRPLAKLTVRTHEGIEIAPLYTAADEIPSAGYPGTPPFARGTRPFGASLDGWEVCQLCDHPDPAVTSRQMDEDRARGVSSVWVKVDVATRLGLDADDPRAVNAGDRGVLAFTTDDLDRLFDPLEMARTRVHLDGGGNALALAATLMAAARRHRIEPASLRVSLGYDPLGALAADGELAYGLDRSLGLVPELVAWARSEAPGLKTLTVSTLPYARAGATAVQELAFALSTGVEYLRASEGAGIEPDACGRQMRLMMAVGRDFFVEIAKLRAARRLWSRVLEAAGSSAAAQAVEIHAVTSARTFSRRDPWVNMLRATVEGFAAASGGADVLTTLPFDAEIGPADDLSRRMAVNTQTILREESHLHRVVDPGGGSWYVEHLTDALARAGWSMFQELEAAGGMRRAFSAEGLGRCMAETLAAKRVAVARRKDPVTGVSTWPHLGEEKVERPTPDLEALREVAVESIRLTREDNDPRNELTALREAADGATGDGAVMRAAIEAAAAGATTAELADALRGDNPRNRIVPLLREREGSGFERLRDASDAWLEEHGERPKIFLATLGPIPEHIARATFAKNFFEAGGFETVGGDGPLETAAAAADAFDASDASLAVICSSDARHVEMAEDAATVLKARGAREVLLAGRPGDHENAWRAAGVDDFIFLGADVLEILNGLLTREGVLS